MTDQQSFRTQLVEWLSEIVPYNQFDKYVRKTQESHLAALQGSDPNRLGLNNSVSYIFCTDAHTYSISANPQYLGCVARSRKERAGENWTRGNDLPDGPFERKTWDAIKAAIIRYEMVQLAWPVKQPPVPDVVISPGAEINKPRNEEEARASEALGLQRRNLESGGWASPEWFAWVERVAKKPGPNQELAKSISRGETKASLGLSKIVFKKPPSPPCGAHGCTVDKDGSTHHQQWCPDYGPGWC